MSKQINVFVNMGMSGRGTSTFQVSADLKVADFIQKVIDKEGAVGVRIITMGKQLEPVRNGKEMTLADYGVYEGLNMSAALRLKGGAAEGPSATQFNIQEVERLGATVVCNPKKPNGPQGDCIYGLNEGCYESNVVKAKFACGCVWCADCMKFYVEKQINVNAAIKLNCGDTSHNRDIDIALAYAVAALSPDDRNKYNAKMAETQFKRPDSLMSICPQGKCKQFVFREDVGSMRVECGVCHQFMCWKCKNDFKGKQNARCGNEYCDDAAYITLLLAGAKMKSIDGVQVTDTRICTNKQCNAVNVHDSACRHMTCKKCKQEYCHICLQDWKSHQSANCNAADEQTITSDMKWK
mmetsp:Transcript_15984/g.24566  ORF Transcript_15984/g.24566 Transcript_15984/m.24566 type:complete len:352 (+) Transcript_15984:79-1134(+)|eukprot:CAMPEP_0202712844 /NCGR_PEP_ID=MMETSP1385-20130828/46487_1 /ASSEMBLY_ACC=CAM_ASM_000861 /TAXON_ID=933848 /ORGANISM="Elphidium margaritaceum" /LENGTH=351 /DNA_ID=CAMNT_0049373007 /DNA_START=74 /DNA_END=1129 /DNA_ORIENTATION=+